MSILYDSALRCQHVWCHQILLSPRLGIQDASARSIHSALTIHGKGSAFAERSERNMEKNQTIPNVWFNLTASLGLTWSIEHYWAMDAFDLQMFAVHTHTCLTQLWMESEQIKATKTLELQCPTVIYGRNRSKDWHWHRSVFTCIILYYHVFTRGRRNQKTAHVCSVPDRRVKRSKTSKLLPKLMQQSSKMTMSMATPLP